MDQLSSTCRKHHSDLPKLEKLQAEDPEEFNIAQLEHQLDMLFKLAFISENFQLLSILHLNSSMFLSHLQYTYFLLYHVMAVYNFIPLGAIIHVLAFAIEIASSQVSQL